MVIFDLFDHFIHILIQTGLLYFRFRVTDRAIMDCAARFKGEKMSNKTTAPKILKFSRKKAQPQDKFSLNEIMPVYRISQNVSIFEDIFYSVDAPYSSLVVLRELQAYMSDVQTIVFEDCHFLCVCKPRQEIFSNSKVSEEK